MSTQIGTGHIHGLSGAALGIASLSGYVSPNLQSLRSTHGAQIDRIKNQGGDTSGLISSDSMLECEFDFVFEGTSIANAKLNGIPDAPAGVTITGLPIIAKGPFTDAYNTNGTNTQPWIYEGGGTVNGPHDGKWTATLPLKRYPQITSATVISA